MNILLVAGSFIIAFLVTYLSVPVWQAFTHRTGLVGKDMNKLGEVKVSEMGGATVLAGFLAGSFYYLGLESFGFKAGVNTAAAFALLATVLIAALIGMVDDLLGWKLGLKQWQKPLLTIPAAIPIILVNAGRSAVDIPFFGYVDWGLVYPLILVPLGVVGAANAFNMLAGYNGLEAGMGVIILGTLGSIAWFKGEVWVGVVALIAAAALLAFLRYNWFPARLFPGDTLTYSIGALIGGVAIMGRLEKIGLLLFIPYFLDFLLPMRRRLKVEAFARVSEDGSLDPPYDQCYDLTHGAIFVLKRVKKKVYERDVVCLLLGVELILAAVAWIWILRY